MIKNKNNSIKSGLRVAVKSLAGSGAKFAGVASSRPTLAVVKNYPAFTLPEVIVAFSVLVLVITSATQILVTVLRVNADNVNSLVAYGLAQEGMEAVRFIRDSDTVLGLQFDGAAKAKPAESVWGQKLFDDVGVKFFSLEVKNSADLKVGCKKASDFSFDCLPVQLKSLGGIIDPESLKTDVTTLVYKKKPTATPDTGLVYFQNDTASSDSTLAATQFHRFIRLESLKSSAAVANIDKLRVSSVVSWNNDNAVPMQVMITSELTDWK